MRTLGQDLLRADVLCAVQMTTGSALISTVGSLTTTYRGTIVVHNEACKQSATVQFKDSSSWKSLGSKKGVKNGVSHPPCDPVAQSCHSACAAL